MFITPAFAQAGLFGGENSGMILQFMPLILIIVIMYFLVLRPQQQKVKQHQAMVKALRRGDTVITNGGVIAKVTKVVDDDQILSLIHIFDLGEALGQMDFDTAAKLSGARFVVLKKGLARLERALGQFMLDVHTSEPHNYTEVSPPLMVRDRAMFGTAQLPKFYLDQFHLYSHEALQKQAAEDAKMAWKQALDLAEKEGIEETRKQQGTIVSEGFVYNEHPDRFWLIPTAEVPLTNLVRESIIDETELPLRFTACTPCFLSLIHI